MSSDKQIKANRENAQHSTGPNTPAGKAKSSLNAVKSGLTGRTVLLPGDDGVAYQDHLAAVERRYPPFNPREKTLVQSIADAEWRIDRIASLEFGIYTEGHIEFAELFATDPEPLRKTRIRNKTFQTYEKQLRNLNLQEARIRKHRDQDIEELMNLQADRRETRNQRLSQAARLLIKAVEEGTAAEWEPEENGFEFSYREVVNRAKALNPNLVEDTPLT